ncbi:MAG TPA: nucleoside hydrolase [Candidatus Limnocylindrales bacterium]|nr:nucleoside hydrolase [Candidatus Limnocylindrales bacterium]
MSGRRPIVVDCDTGIDDSLALLYLLASDDAEIVAITCCSGNVEAHQVAENNRGLLELVGRSGIEVALGRTVPLVRPLEITPETHGPRGVGYAELPPGRTPLSQRHAADLFAEAAGRRPGELTLLCIGPLTNLAVALEREPSLPRLLRRLVVMGGAFRVPGNTTPVSEWNVHCDPDAARAVMRAWSAAIEADTTVPRILVLGLDVTEQAIIRPADVVALAHRAGSRPDDTIAVARGEDPLLAERSVASNPVVRFVADALRFYMEFHAQYDGFYGAFIHDPLAAAAALDERLVQTQAVAVDVETGGDLSAGQTIADFRGLWHRAPNVDLAVAADAGAFLERWIERVGGLAERLGVAAGVSDVAP